MDPTPEPDSGEHAAAEPGYAGQTGRDRPRRFVQSGRVHECPECGGVGTSPTHRPDCKLAGGTA